MGAGLGGAGLAGAGLGDEGFPAGRGLLKYLEVKVSASEGYFPLTKLSKHFM